MIKKLLVLMVISLSPAAALSGGVGVNENHLTGEKTISLSIDSDTQVPNSIGAMKSATLVLRCESEKLKSYIWTPTYNGVTDNKSTLKIKFDGNIHKVPGVTGKIFTDRVNTNPGGDAFFLPTPNKFVKSLLLHSSFVAAWTPYGRVEASAKWNLDQHFFDLLEFGKMCNVVAGDEKALLRTIEVLKKSSQSN